MQWKTRIRKLPTFVGSFRISIFNWQNATKTCVLQWRTRIPKLPTIVGSFRNLVLSGKTQKIMRFTLENPNTETAHNCWQFPYLNFKWEKAKKHAFYNRKSKY